MNPFWPPLRPPGATNERTFVTKCIRCGRCVEVCPHHSLRLFSGFGLFRLTPRIEPDVAPCLLCMKCTTVCPTGALDNGVKDMSHVRMGQAHIRSDRCHNYTDGIICMTCFDRCPLRNKAVVLEGGLTPMITTACAGCGNCQYVCPTKAIEVYPNGVIGAPESAIPTKIVQRDDGRVFNPDGSKGGGA